MHDHSDSVGKGATTIAHKPATCIQAIWSTEPCTENLYQAPHLISWSYQATVDHHLPDFGSSRCSPFMVFPPPKTSSATGQRTDYHSVEFFHQIPSDWNLAAPASRTVRLFSMSDQDLMSETQITIDSNRSGQIGDNGGDDCCADYEDEKCSYGHTEPLLGVKSGPTKRYHKGHSEGGV